MIRSSADDPVTGSLYTVSEITEALRQHLETEFSEVSIIGEVANFKAHSSGHYYFSLRDESNLLRVVVFRRHARSAGPEPRNGMLLLATGRISHYGASGQTQLLAHTFTEAGRGSMEIEYNRLLRRLMDEGLTAPERKRCVPPYPSRIVVIASPTGAVVRDIAGTVERRWPVAEIIHIMADVQGPRAERSILGAFDVSNGIEDADVVILARGGGSVEDLWTFNLESVARAVSSSVHPVITGIGHEIDTTVADYVSDLRAATPTAAAELATPSIDEVRNLIDERTDAIALLYRRSADDRLQLLEYVLRSSAFPAIVHGLERSELRTDELTGRLGHWWGGIVGEISSRTLALSMRLEKAVDLRLRVWSASLDARLDDLSKRDPTARVSAVRERVRRMANEMRMGIEFGIALKRRELEQRQRALSGLHPLEVLGRGYTYCTSPDGSRVIGSTDDIVTGDEMMVHFRDGGALCEVEEKRKGAPWRKRRASKRR
jgi:exodeoxyribonuclease VII large subunit